MKFIYKFVREKLKILDRTFLYAFFSLFIKCMIFVAFMGDKTRLHPNFKFAIKLVFGSFAFRPFYYIGFIMVFLSIALFSKGTSRVIQLIFMNLLFSFLFMVGLWYLRGFDTLPTLHMFEMKSNLNNTGSSISAMIHIIDLVFILDIPFVFIYAVVKRNLYRSRQRSYLFASMTLILSLFLIIFAAPLSNKITKNIPANWIFYKYDMINTAYNISPIGYDVYSSYLYFRDSRSMTLSPEEKKSIKTWFENKKENLPDNQYKGLFKGKNLLIIQVESLEKFVINQKINNQVITPNLDKLLKNSLYFTGIYQQNGEGVSSDADLMTNASVYPITVGTTFYSYPNTQYNSLPKLMKGIGYYTSVFHPDPGSFWNWLPALSSMGFDKCTDSSNYDTKEKIGIGISDRSYFTQIEPMIEEQKKPFYTFVVTLSSHTPFILPKNLEELNLNSDLDKSRIGGYLQSIHYADEQIGMLLNKLKKDGILDNTVTVIYGDHEGLHKYFPQDVMNFSPSQSWWLDNHKQLPLFIYEPGFHGKVINTIGGQIDILPTISYLMGVDEKKYENTAMGRNLLKTNKSFAVLRTKQVISDKPDKNQNVEAQKGLMVADMIIRSDYFNKN